MHEIDLREIFECAHLKFMVYGCKHVNTLPQCSPASVGLTQAHPNYVTSSQKLSHSSCSGGLRQTFITVQTSCHRKFMVYFADKKSTIGFCFASCYCIVVDDVNKQIGFYGNAPPSRKQRPLIKAA